MIRLVMLTCVAMLAAGDDNEIISVPKDVLKFIIGCRQAPPGGQYAVPVHQTDINDATGTTSQHISLLSLEELRESLENTVHNKAVLGHIISQVEDAVKTDQLSTGRADCTVQNHITIDVPPQEIDDFNDRVQMLMRQNTFLLLEQINTLFSYKLRDQNINVEKFIRRRTNQINEKLDKIMLKLGIEIEEEEVIVDDVDVTTEFPNESEDDNDLVTVFPESWSTIIFEPEPESISEPEPEPISEPEPEPITEPEPEYEPVTEIEIDYEYVTIDEDGPSITATPAVAEPVTEVGMTDAPIRPTELIPVIGSSSNSSEEIDDEGGFISPTRISGSNPNPDPDFIRTPQQPFVFNSGIGFIRPLTRPRPNLRPVYPGAAALQERMRLAAQRRRFTKTPQGT